MHRTARVLAVVTGIALVALAGTAFAEETEEESEASAPTITSVAAADVSAESALLRAYVNPEGAPTSYFFQYGPTTAYGSESTHGSAGSGSSAELRSATVVGLQPDTTYHYRAVATNPVGTTRGADRTFTTPARATADNGGPVTDGGEPVSIGGGNAPGPRLGSTVTLEPHRGTVRVRARDGSAFVPLSAGADLPVGSEVDARRGSIALTSALRSGDLQTGRFGGGRFLIRQGRTGRVDLHLRGRACRRHGGNAATGEPSPLAAARRRSARRLWGRDRGGRFRTHGRNSHATVRGTRWLVADRCGGTLTRVTDGSVVVYDKAVRRHVRVAAGEHYFARPGRRAR